MLGSFIQFIDKWANHMELLNTAHATSLSKCYACRPTIRDCVLDYLLDCLLDCLLGPAVS